MTACALQPMQRRRSNPEFTNTAWSDLGSIRCSKCALGLFGHAKLIKHFAMSANTVTRDDDDGKSDGEIDACDYDQSMKPLSPPYTAPSYWVVGTIVSLFRQLHL